MANVTIRSNGLIETTPETVISKIEKQCGKRNPFYFNGHPYLWAKVIEVEENDVRVLFKFRRFSDGMSDFFYKNSDDSEVKHWVPKDSIKGYEMIDIFDGKKYVGTFINVITK